MISKISIADLFCGAGGTSTGAIDAMHRLGFDASLTAVNHWDIAIATHSKNHPEARHLCTSIDDLNPRNLFPEGLDMLWASPECTHHSVARGGKPINDQSRATAWCVTRWAEAVRPEVILVENVPEFVSWGALGESGRPLQSKKGATFRAWLAALRSMGYRVDYKILCAADYGDPTTRRRLFVQAVRGKRKIVWPNPTHAPEANADLFGRVKPWRTAREIIDWSIEGESIFKRKRPLALKTIKRIEAGLIKYGLKGFLIPQQSWHESRSVDLPLPALTTTSTGEGLARPFLVKLSNNQDAESLDDPVSTVRCSGAHHGLVQPYLIPGFGEREGQEPRCHSIDEPAPTVAATGHTHLVEPYIVSWDNQSSGKGFSGADEPVSTVTTKARHGVAQPFLVEYYGQGQAQSVDEPLPTATTQDRFALVQPVLEIQGQRYLLDIRFRMLQPHELAAAQGFPKHYKFAGNKTETVKQIGNAVPCGIARALVAAVWSQQNDVSEILEPVEEVCA